VDLVSFATTFVSLPLQSFGFYFKMTSYLNLYPNFINVTTKDGQALLSNATDKFESPLIGDNKISLQPGGKDYQRLKDNLTHLLQRYGYQYLLQNVPTVRTVIPAIPPVIENLALGIAAAPEVPEAITCTNEINMLEIYLDKLLEISQKNSSRTRGNRTFTVQNPRVNRELTQANSELTPTSTSHSRAHPSQFRVDSYD